MFYMGLKEKERGAYHKYKLTNGKHSICFFFLPRVITPSWQIKRLATSFKKPKAKAYKGIYIIDKGG